MHELGIMRSVVQALSRQEPGFAPAKLRTAVLLVGERRGFAPEWVQMMFDVLTEGTSLNGAKIVLETVPATACCPTCGTTFRCTAHGHRADRCPDCGEENVIDLTGDELIIKQIEVEEPDQ